MRKDPTEFRERFKKWQSGEKVYEAGLPKYEGGGEAVRVGDYNIYPSAIGASELNVTTPEIVVTGKDKRPLYQKYDAHNSMYHPEDAMTGFNALTFGGLNNLSPSQWARRIYDTPKLFRGDMNASLYFDKWINGNEGIVTTNFEKNHPYWSMLINGGADILTGAAANKLQQLNKLSRLEKMYTSVPKKADVATGELMPDLFRKGYNGTVWTSSNPDYGHYLTSGGETFDIYFDPKKLNLMDTPHAPNGTYFVWNRLPFKTRRGNISIDPKAEIDNTAFMYDTKSDVLANTDRFGVLFESNEALHPIMEPRLMNKNTLGFKEGLKTDHVVKYSKQLKYDGARFHNIFDGGAEDLRGFAYDTPIEEVVLNPGAEYFFTEHGAGLRGMLNKMPYKNISTYTKAGALSNITNTRNEPRKK